MPVEQLRILGTRAENNYPIGRDRKIIDSIRLSPGISETEVSHKMGVSLANVSRSIQKLSEEGWIRNPDQKPRVRRRPGPPERLNKFFEVNPDAGYFLGVQVEADSIKVRGVDFSFKKMEDFDEEILLPQNNTPSYINSERLQEALGKSLQKLQQIGKLQRLMAIGISLPGQLTNESYSLRGNLEIIKYIFSMIEIGDTVLISWDRSAKCAGQVYMETCVFPNRDAKSVYYVNLGKSVEAAIFFDKKLFYGNQGGAGGPSHYPLENQEKETRCGCGINECTVYELSESATVLKWNKTNNGNNNQPFDEIARLTREGNPTAQKFFSEYGEKLAEYLYTSILILNPSIIAIDGKIAEYWTLFSPFLYARIEKLIGLKYVKETMSLRFLNRGSDAKAIGAAIMAYHKLGR